MADQFNSFDDMVRERLQRRVGRAPLPAGSWADVRARRERRVVLRRTLACACALVLFLGLGWRIWDRGAPPITGHATPTPTLAPTATIGEPAVPVATIADPGVPAGTTEALPTREAPTSAPSATPTASPTSSPTASPTASPTTSPTSTPTPPPTEEVSPFVRRDDPPAGLPASYSLSIGGGIFGCQALPDDSLGLQITIYWPEPEIGEGFSMCFSGQDRGVPIDLVITDPYGRATSYTVPVGPFGPESFDWVSFPDDPLGRYSVVASQLGNTAQASFTVLQATEPRLMVEASARAAAVHSATLAPGRSLRVIVAGFEPGQQVELHLYRMDGWDAGDLWHYNTRLATVTADENGHAVYQLNTRQDDPAGRYQIRPLPDMDWQHWAPYGWFVLEE